MTTLSTSFVVITQSPALNLSSGSSLRQTDQHACSTKLAFSSKNLSISSTKRRALTIQAGYSDGRGSSGGNSFIGGFIIGGLIVGTLGCVYAPQISKAITGAAGADKKDLMKKLPKFLYDEEKALERQRKKLSEKIEQLNSAIDNVSNQLRSEELPNEAAVSAEDMEAVV